MEQNLTFRGSYPRKALKNDVLYSYYRHRDVTITFAKKTGPATRVTDDLVRKMRDEGIITPEAQEACEKRAGELFARTEDHDECTVEAIYGKLQALRREQLGAAALERARENAFREGVPAELSWGIDQREKKAELLASGGTVVMALYQAELFSWMRRDLEEALRRGTRVCLLVSREEGALLPTRECLTRWLGDIQGLSFLEEGGGLGDCLLVYGEDGFLLCRELPVDAFVQGIPRGYYAQAVTNQLGRGEACGVFVPKGLDITRWVKLTERTRLSYWQLAKLWEAHGDRVYGYTPEELYARWPQYFLNIYENGERCAPAEPGWPIRVQMPAHGEDVFAGFDRAAEEAVGAYLNGFSGIRYCSAYFDEALQPGEICRDSRQKQKGILVQGVRVKQSRGARVIPCGKGTTPRQALSGYSGAAVVSNFLFFLTPKLGVLYNDLRRDRPREQADAAAGHLDYMLARQDGKRIETFPLFRKTCIAMKENGEFLFFNFRLGGGSLRLGGQTLRWTAEDVDAPPEDGAIRVFTPYASRENTAADRQTYRELVGAGRINLLILQDRIHCIRRGDVVMPSVGVVVSLEESLGQALLERLGLSALEDGYFDTSGLEMTLELEPPKEISAEEWQQVRWAYGGGMSLILEGRGLCDGDPEPWFREEGWMSPLSRQTQESALHTMAKHPRTAIGITKGGELVILVFSGRTWRSSGADYREMIAIARQLVPDIRTLMNVDGGGSAVLGMAVDGSFLELSCPSTSTGSCAGMVRPVNTVFYIPIQK